ncbi:MAG: hypothetical protein ACYSWU_06995 [Planctomycetota bacterium]
MECGICHVAYLTSEDGRIPIVYLSWPEIELLAAAPAVVPEDSRTTGH